MREQMAKFMNGGKRIKYGFTTKDVIGNYLL